MIRIRLFDEEEHDRRVDVVEGGRTDKDAVRLIVTKWDEEKKKSISKSVIVIDRKELTAAIKTIEYYENQKSGY